MKKVIAAGLLLIATSTAIASCPIGTVYRCYATPSGKMLCGCF